eukprot:scaffold1062_cov119-Isochrysis_galbana.AAC.4
MHLDRGRAEHDVHLHLAAAGHLTTVGLHTTAARSAATHLHLAAAGCLTVAARSAAECLCIRRQQAATMAAASRAAVNCVCMRGRAQRGQCILTWRPQTTAAGRRTQVAAGCPSAASLYYGSGRVDSGGARLGRWTSAGTFYVGGVRFGVAVWLRLRPERRASSLQFRLAVPRVPVAGRARCGFVLHSQLEADGGAQAFRLAASPPPSHP